MSNLSLNFEIQSQKKSGQSIFELKKKRIVIGSSESADLRLDDPSVSPIHGIVEVDANHAQIVIYDLASETGIRVDGQSVVQSNVRIGQKIQLGAFILLLQDKVQAQATPVYQEQKAQEKEVTKALILEDSADIQEIFDHTPEQKQSLQVVMFYGDTILDVEHFVDRKAVVIGPKSKDDFAVPPMLASIGNARGRYELVSMQGGHYTLNLHESMSGVVSREGALRTVKDVLSAKDGSKMVELAYKDFAKISLGDVSFFINFSPAPPRLKHQRLFSRDPLFARIWMASLAMTLLLMVTMTHVTVTPVIEIEQLPERIATVIYKPELLPIEKPKPVAPPVEKKEEQEKPKPVEKKPPPPKVIHVKPRVESPKPAPKNAMIDEVKKEQPKQPPKAAQPKPVHKAPSPKPAAPAAGNEGEGARAKGENGTRGKPQAKPSDTHQTKAARPGEGNKNNPAVARQGHSQVQDLGVVDVFKSTGGSLNKALAGGKGVSGAADKLEGFGGFTTQGAGGLGDAGSGSGGGGQSEGLGGLSDKGVGGGKHGKGLGALGTGGNIIGGKGRLVIAGTNGAPEPIVLGAIDSDAIAREIAKHRDEIKYCYEKEINAEHPDISGRVSIKWVIGASGSVSSAGVSSTSLHNANVESCVVDVIRRIVFPPVRGGGIAEVTYPFVFRPAKQ